MSWLTLFTARAATGERWRKATPAERRWYAGWFLFIPIFLSAFSHLGHALLDNAGSFILWVYMTAAGVGTFFGLVLWGRHVPAAISVALGVAVWAVALWMAFTGRFI
jgi:hypothetical protein